MKKILHISLLFSLIAGFVAAAPSNSSNLIINDLNVARKGDKVYVDFSAQVGSKATASNYNLTVIPILTDKETRREFRPIVIQGSRAKIAYERNYRLSGFDPFQNAVFATNDEMVYYSASIPFESWMLGADLVLDGVSEGCCSSERKPLDIIAKNLLVQKAKAPEAPVAPMPMPELPVTTGDAIAQQYGIIQPMANLNADQSGKEKAIIIYFKVNSTTIERDYRTNYDQLVELISVIRKMEKSNDSRISKVVISGYASPEGMFSHNLWLARTRADALRDFIKMNSSIDVSDFQMYNGGEDWDGLRKMVAESNMPDRQRVLDIIDGPKFYDDHHPNGRLAQLKSLNGGQTYRYLFNNFFPDLRNATYVRVFYQNNQ